MAKKTTLKDKETGEKIYPNTLAECVYITPQKNMKQLLEEGFSDTNIKITNDNNDFAPGENGEVTLDSALHQVFQNANSGKNLLKSAIGLDNSTEFTFSEIGESINNMKGSLKTFLNSNNVDVADNDTFPDLINKLNNIKTGGGTDVPSGSFILPLFMSDINLRGDTIYTLTCTVGNIMYIAETAASSIKSMFEYNTTENTLTSIELPKSPIFYSLVPMNGKLYCFKDRDVLIYDTVSKTWETKVVTTDTSISLGYYANTIKLNDEEILMFSKTYKYIYNVNTNTLTKTSSSYENKSYYKDICYKYGDFIYRYIRSVTDKPLARYNLITDTYESLDLDGSKSFCAGGIFKGDKFYYIGGYDPNSNSSNPAYSYKVYSCDLATKEIKREKDTPLAISCMRGEVIEDKIYCIGEVPSGKLHYSIFQYIP